MQANLRMWIFKRKIDPQWWPASECGRRKIRLFNVNFTSAWYLCNHFFAFISLPVRWKFLSHDRMVRTRNAMETIMNGNLCGVGWVDVSQSDSKKKKKKKKKKKSPALGWNKVKKFSAHNGHMIKCLLTQIDRARRENIWLSVMTHGFRSVGYDLEPHIFPFDPLGQ